MSVFAGEKITLNSQNYSAWLSSIHLNIFTYGEAAHPIKSGEARVREPRPVKSLRDEDSEFKYRQSETGVLTDAGYEHLHVDQISYDSRTSKLFDKDCALQVFLLSTISPESLATIQTREAEYTVAMQTNPFALFNLICACHSQASGQQTLARTVEFITISQGEDTHEAYLQRHNTGMQNLKHDHGGTGEHANCINIDELGSTVYVAGLDQAFFRVKIDTTLDAAVDGKLKDLPKLRKTFHQFYQDRQTNQQQPNHAFVASQKPVSKTHSLAMQQTEIKKATAVPPSCLDCDSPTAINRTTGEPFLRCGPCHQLRKTRRATDSTSFRTANALSAAWQAERMRQHFPDHSSGPEDLDGSEGAAYAAGFDQLDWSKY